MFQRKSSITVEELHTFYTVERQIFSRMVMCLMRDPGESLLVLAVWLWLEELGLPPFLEEMVYFSDLLVDSLSNEAVSCIRCLQSWDPPMTAVGGGLPLTSRFMEHHITLHMIYENKYASISGIKNVLDIACSRVFTDTLQNVLGPGSFLGSNIPLTIPGFPHSLFGNLVVLPNSVKVVEFPGGLDKIWRWNLFSNVTEKDKTMFLTFSRGFPVTEEEVMELFTTLYGEDCVVGVNMQESVGSGEQPLFAKMVLDTITTVDRILRGRHIAKFRVNGKHLWARRYERRDQSI